MTNTQHYADTLDFDMQIDREKLQVIAMARKVQGGYAATIRWRKNGQEQGAYLAGTRDTRKKTPVYGTPAEAVRIAWADIQVELVNRYRIIGKRVYKRSVSFDVVPILK